MKNTLNDIESEQSRRVLSILKLFIQNRIMSTNEVCSSLTERFGGVSKRSIQRDLSILRDEGYIELNHRGAKSQWLLSNSPDDKSFPLKIKESEVLSLYILKSYLNTFKNTKIEKDVLQVIKKLETMVPGDIFIEENFCGNQNIGFYDYSDKDYIIQKLIGHINEKNVIKIKYNRIYDDNTTEYILYPQFLYTYSGTTYLVAYNSVRKKSSSFAIQNIIEISEIDTTFFLMKPFNFEEFRKERFAVFDGELNEVKMLIKKPFVKYFKNRSWHPTQTIKYDLDKNLILTMKVPISPDFVAWICNWSEAIIVLEPNELKETIINLLNKTLKNYK